MISNDHSIPIRSRVVISFVLFYYYCYSLILIIKGFSFGGGNERINNIIFGPDGRRSCVQHDLTTTSTCTSKRKSRTQHYRSSFFAKNVVLLPFVVVPTRLRSKQIMATNVPEQQREMSQYQDNDDESNNNSKTNNNDDDNCMTEHNNNSKSLRHTLGLLQQDHSTTSSSSNIPKVVGHRGAMYEYLENTRKGFYQCAIEWQIDAIELDVFVLPKDNNTVIVFHGDTDDGDIINYCLDNATCPSSINSTTSTNEQKQRNIMDYTYDEILQLQFNPEHTEFPCPKEHIRNTSISYIPTLEQVLLDLQNTNCRIKIELKGPNDNVVLPVLTLVEQLNMQSQCCYSSFHFHHLYKIRQLRPDKTKYPTGALFHGIPPTNYIELCHDMNVTEIHLRYDCCHVNYVQEIHTNGFRCMAWLRGPVGMEYDIQHNYCDVGSSEGTLCYQAIIDTGVDEICCNKPNILQSMLQNTKQRAQVQQQQQQQQQS